MAADFPLAATRCDQLAFLAAQQVAATLSRIIDEGLLEALRALEPGA
jgi:hypothetical protein